MLWPLQCEGRKRRDTTRRADQIGSRADNFVGTIFEKATGRRHERGCSEARNWLAVEYVHPQHPVQRSCNVAAVAEAAYVSLPGNTFVIRPLCPTASPHSFRKPESCRPEQTKPRSPEKCDRPGNT
eukprot:1811981-Rhodomonas_salina.7